MKNILAHKLFRTFHQYNNLINNHKIIVSTRMKSSEKPIYIYYLPLLMFLFVLFCIFVFSAIAKVVLFHEDVAFRQQMIQYKLLHLISDKYSRMG